MPPFRVQSPFTPAGDQPRAIDELAHGFASGIPFQTLLGVTGSGKTYTIARVIERLQRPTLVMTHNKTLAAQLYSEFKSLFPENAVEYFVSYYDYYQPEAYLPATDTYIEKDSRINEEIERLRLRATSSLMTRKDVLIVASVSCIYGLGSPEEYKEMTVSVSAGETRERSQLLRQLVAIQYRRNDIDFSPGAFRVRGDIIEVRPAYGAEDEALRIELFGDEVERLSRVGILKGEIRETVEQLTIFPARHFVTSTPRVEQAMETIQKELEDRLALLESQNKLLELQRLESRTRYDLEMLEEIGYCSGIENYSRHFEGRGPGTRPNTLIDYFPGDFLLVADESHVTLPQVRGMFEGDRSRKEKLVDHGFRLPSAMDNRPLKYPEFESLINQAIFLSATPGDEELKKSEGVVVELVIRPTGLVDPPAVIKPVKGQIDDLLEEIRQCVERKERALVTTLTKRMAEHLSEYLAGAGIRVRYLHSEIDTLERTEILRDLRKGEFDVLVGINLLREGLDLPETSLVAILDADKEGFLRSTTSLIQTAGRASRNINGRVVMYADTVTDSIRNALDEMERRRRRQTDHNREHNITPRTTYRPIEESMAPTADVKPMLVRDRKGPAYVAVPSGSIEELREQMMDAAGKLDFERAAVLRDKIKEMQNPSPAKKAKRDPKYHRKS